jgi:small subunit ribosomal protein S6
VPNSYEVTYILRPTIDETEVDAKVAGIGATLVNAGGEVVGEVDKMGKRRLAYEIDDMREGYYNVMKFSASAEAAKELERLLRLNEDVLRALVIRLDG